MELHIWRFQVFACFHEAGGKAGGHRHWACAVHQVFKANLGLPKQTANFVVQRWFITFVNQAGLQVVLHVLAHAVQIFLNLNAVLLQLGGFADA